MSVSPKTSAKAALYVSKKEEEDGELYFTIENLNVSFANGIRRTILSDIPTLAIKTFPDKENQAKIITNTSRFNNEILKQRLSCIPIHGVTHDQPYDELEIIIDKQNDGHDIIYVTTEDFKIKNTKSDKFLSDTVVRKIFPTDPITGDYILLARLRPRISNEVPGESLEIHAKMSLHTASEDGSFNVASCCSYRNTPDKIRQDNAWQEHAKTLLAPSDLAMTKSDWYNHEAGRIYKDDSFDFKIQTLGVFENSAIVKNACIILSNKFIKLLDKFAPDKISSVIQQESRSTIENSYDLKLVDIGYTCGKVLEFLLHDKFYKGGSGAVLSYIGFRKDHPHDSHSTIRIAFINPSEKSEHGGEISAMLTDVCKTAIDIYNGIADEFK